MAERNSKAAGKAVFGFGAGAVFWLWAAAAQAESLSEQANQFMIAIGMITPLHNLVDYYTHIKGIEYLICVAFFFIFPVFYMYVNKDKKRAAVKS